MAKQKPKRSLSERLLLGEPAALKTVRGKKKPFQSDVGLAPSYNLVFDPTGQQSELLKGEADAVRDLYLRRVGEDIASRPDTRAALEESGLIHSGARGGGAPGKQPELFASAADALDWLDQNAYKLPLAGTSLLGTAAVVGYQNLVPEKTKKVIEQKAGEVARLGEQNIGRIIAPAIPPQAFKAAGPTIKKGIKAAGKAAGEIPVTSTAVAGPFGPLLEQKFPKFFMTQGELQGKAQEIAANPGKFIAPATKHPEGVPSRNKQLTAALDVAGNSGSVDEIRSILGPEAILSQPDDLRLYQWAVGEGWSKDKKEWASLSPEEKLFRSTNSNNFLATTARNAVKFIAAQAALPAGFIAIGEAAVDALGGDVKPAEDLVKTAIEPYARYRRTAQDRGTWAASVEFIRENPGEFVLAVNSALRVGGAASGIAARAGLPMAARATPVIARGVGRLAGERAAAAAERGAGRVIGAVSAVSYPYQQVTVQGPTVKSAPVAPVLPRLPGEWAGPIRATEPAVFKTLAEQDRLWSEYEKAIDEFSKDPTKTVDVSVPVLVGITGKNPLANAYLRYLKAPVVGRPGRLQRRIMKKQAGERPTRFLGNMAQGIKIDLIATLERELQKREGSRIRKPVDRLTKERAAFNLTRPLVRRDGSPYTPGFEASMFEHEAALLRKTADPTDLAKQQDIIRMEEYARYLRRIDEVVIPDEVMARLREVAKPYGDQADMIAADIMSNIYGRPVSLEEARRANYIRPLVTEGEEFKAAARQIKRVQNVRLSILSRSQRRIQSLSKRISIYASETGWGMYGRKQSVLRYEAARKDLVKELRRAARIAEKTGEAELAAGYRDALARLEAGRGAGAVDTAELQRVVNGLERGTLTPQQVERLTPEQQALYAEATAAGREAARLESEVVRPGLERLGRISAQSVNSRDVALSRYRLDDLKRQLDEARQYEASGDPKVAATIAKLEERVNREADALSQREAILSAKQAIAAQRKIEKRNVRALKREFDRGEPVFATRDLEVTLGVSKQFAVVRPLRVREMNYYTINRALNEDIDQYIARLMANDQQAVLHLVQHQNSESIGTVSSIQSNRALIADARMIVGGGRFIESEGYTFSTGKEAANMWENLLFDVSNIISADAMAKGIERIVQTNGIRFEFTPDAIARANAMVDNGTWNIGIDGTIDPSLTKLANDLGILPSGEPGKFTDAEIRGHQLAAALSNIVRSQSVAFDMNDFVPLNLKAPKARKPSQVYQKGVVDVTQPEYLGDLMWKQLSGRTIDPGAGEYILLPRAIFDGIQKGLADEAFRLRRPKNDNWFRVNLGSVYGLDKLTRMWRTFTLNLLPRTAFVNMAGSSILALQGGASPYAMMLAFKAINGIPHNGRLLPVPPELRQRYYEQLFTDPTKKGLTPEEFAQYEPSFAEGAMAYVSYYMNTLRYANGMSEDLGRLAIWYQQAYPEAIRAADGVRFFASARRLSDDAIDMIETMAKGEDGWQVKNAAWQQKAFDFLGDLHKGGQVASTVRIAIPFWQWYLHMVKLQLFTMPIHYPGRAMVMQMISDIGEEYQREHGVFVPWGLDWIPIPGKEFIDRTLGGPQAVFLGISSGNIYPQNTVSQFADRNGDLKLWKAANDIQNPLLSNIGFMALNTINALNGGVVQEPGSDQFMQAAKDAFGSEIEASFSNPEFWNFMMNRLMRMVPLSPTIMSQAGQASNSTVFSPVEKQKKGARLEYGDQYRSDIRTIVENLFSDPNTALRVNLPALLFRTTFGLSMTPYYGSGPLRDQSFQKGLESAAYKKSNEERMIRERLMEQLNLPGVPAK